MDNEILSEETEETTPDNITEETSALEEISEPEELSEAEELSESEVIPAKIPETNGFKRFFKAEKGKSKEETAMYYVREIGSWILILFVSFVIAILFNMYVLRMSNVVGDSMLDTYHSGDRVVISKLPYVFGDPKYGDVIIFDSTKEEKNFFEDFGESCRFNMITQMFMSQEQKTEVTRKYYIKRIIGVEGDVISFKDGKIFRNGELLKEDYIKEEPIYLYPNGSTFEVGEGELFVMGDNRNNSKDSRMIGCIPEGCVLGKVVFD